MLRNLNPQKVVRWLLVGLNDSHRALVRRVAAGELMNTHRSIASRQSKGPASDAEHHGSKGDVEVVTFDWTICEQLGDFESTVKSSSWSVIVIDRNTIVSAPDDTDAMHWIATSMRCNASSAIRLLWSWLPNGNQDLMWSSMLSMSGVISDIPSLRSWSRAVVQHANSKIEQTNALLEHIELPNLSAVAMHQPNERHAT
jgi:hypothetical protein